MSHLILCCVFAMHPVVWYVSRYLLCDAEWRVVVNAKSTRARRQRRQRVPRWSTSRRRHRLRRRPRSPRQTSRTKKREERSETSATASHRRRQHTAAVRPATIHVRQRRYRRHRRQFGGRNRKWKTVSGLLGCVCRPTRVEVAPTARAGRAVVVDVVFVVAGERAPRGPEVEM